jgi:hypothetical protein
MLSRSSLFTCLPLTWMLIAGSAHAATIYSNVTNFSGSAFADGGATVTAGTDTTKLIADDITVASGFGGAVVDSFSFAVANLNAAAVTARPLVRFYDDDGAGNGPGTLLGSFDFNPISFGADAVAIFTFTASNLFTVPSGGTFWAAITFDDNAGTTGATQAQMNELGMGIFGPPTVGSSQDSFFETTSAGDFASNDPAGGFFNFGGNPVGDFGWSFDSAATTTPEPGTGMLSLLAAIPLAAYFRVRRRQRAGNR